MTSCSGAEDTAESEDPGGGGKERYGGHSTKEEVHEQQRKEEELVQDEEEGKDCISSAEGHISHLSSPVCVRVCARAVEEGRGEVREGAAGG